jgi:hypothetical protein
MYANQADGVKNLVFECHSIATAISMIITELKVVHGYYLGIKLTQKEGRDVFTLTSCYHSWLVTPDGAILDPYPVGYTVLIDTVLVPTKGNLVPYGANQYVHQKGIRFRMTRKEIRSKALILKNIINKAHEQIA